MSRNISAAVLVTTLIILHSEYKKPIKRLFVLKGTKFHVQLRNIQYYSLILVLYKKTCTHRLIADGWIPKKQNFVRARDYMSSKGLEPCENSEAREVEAGGGGNGLQC